MDIKAKIEEIVEMIKTDDELKDLFRTDPIKAVEKVLGVDLPDDIIQQVVEGVKAKISVDKISNAFSAFKKLF